MSARSLERAAREALLDAARKYADGDTEPRENTERLADGARLRLAAKEWRRAERAAKQT